jgi:hypothetical protein
MNTLGIGGIVPPFLTSALVGGGMVSLWNLIPEEIAPGTHCIGGWGGLQSQSGGCAEETNLPRPEIELRPALGVAQSV